MLYDENGNLVEGAQTPEEVEAIKQEALKATEELQKLQDELKSKSEELDKLSGKDLNFKNLREAKEKAEKELLDIKGTIDSKIKEVETKLSSKFTEDYLASRLIELSNGDEETQKKLKFHFDRLVDPATTKAEIDKKLADAVAIVSVADRGVLRGNIISSAGAGSIKTKQKVELSPEARELGKKLGITDADIQKHGK